MAQDWDTAVREVLQENTAQAIFQQLSKQESLREKYANRWIWELFQNALDAAPPNRPVQVRIAVDAAFHFRHDGLPFSQKSLLHLIYHGSTKAEEPDSIGRYGTGFLTTHIVSPSVGVQGVLDGTDRFDFTLDRGGSSAADLAARMERSFAQLRQSLRPVAPTEERWTHYSYPLDSVSSQLVSQTLGNLARLAPYVLAFNRGITSIAIDAGHRLIFQVFRRTPVENGVSIVEIGQTGSAAHVHVAFVEVDATAVALPLQRSGNRFSVCPLGDVPCLFVGFPLFGTERLGLPFVLNCLNVDPLPERDGAYLSPGRTESNEANKRLLQQAATAFIRVVCVAARHQWEGLVHVAALPDTPALEWLDADWFKCYLKTLLTTLRDTPLVDTVAGERKPPTAVFFPTAPEQVLESHRQLVVDMFGPAVPVESAVAQWAGVIESWQRLCEPGDPQVRTVTVTDLAQRVSECLSLAGLSRAIARLEGTPVVWLNRLFLAMEACGILSKLTDALPLLPSQGGVFQKRSELHRDVGIDEELKDVARLLARDVRPRLCDADVVVSIQELLPEYHQDALLGELMATLSLQAKSAYGTDAFRQANSALFSWLARAQRANELRTFPVISRAVDDKGHERVAATEHPLLAPVGLWQAAAQPFEGLFPKEYVASELYSGLAEQTWAWLQDCRLFRLDPVFCDSRSLDEEELSSLFGSELGGGENVQHGVGGIEGMDIACLHIKDRGVRDTVRKSGEKVMLFLRFLVEHALPATEQYLRKIPVQCACGMTHPIHRAFWLGSLCGWQWVPERKGHSERATASNLARYWREAGLSDQLADDRVFLFLAHLGISPSDLARHIFTHDEQQSHDYEKAMLRLLTASGHDPAKLEQAAEILADQAMILEHERRKALRERARRNQALGRAVEDRFRELFETPEIVRLGIRIEREPIGSDFAIEYDWVENETEIAFAVQAAGRRYLVEVKSASGSAVAMTETQGRTAARSKDRFALCVVESTGSEDAAETVRRNARFVTQIGALLEGKVDEVAHLVAVRAQTRMPGNIEVEINEGEIRYRIKKPVWEAGLPFESFVQFLLDFFKELAT
jgi:hypothetical protein